MKALNRIASQITNQTFYSKSLLLRPFITGDTGTGKTSSGLNKLLISLTEHYPHWGALVLDPKGVYWQTLQTMLEAAGRPGDLAVLRVRSPQETARDDNQLRFNLMGDPTVPCSTYAQMIVDTHAAHRAGSAAGNSDFFDQRAMEHISKCFELMRALDLPFNLRTAYNLLVNKDQRSFLLSANVTRVKLYQGNGRRMYRITVPDFGQLCVWIPMAMLRFKLKKQLLIPSSSFAQVPDGSSWTTER